MTSMVFIEDGNSSVAQTRVPNPLPKEMGLETNVFGLPSDFQSLLLLLSAPGVLALQHQSAPKRSGVESVGFNFRLQVMRALGSRAENTLELKWLSESVHHQ